MCLDFFNRNEKFALDDQQDRLSLTIPQLWNDTSYFKFAKSNEF